MQGKISYNNKRQLHGIWETYSTLTEEINSKGFFVNDVDYGFWIEGRIKFIYYAR
jgi:hypothetical protein